MKRSSAEMCLHERYSTLPQRADALVVVVVGRADVGEHEGLGVATQRVLQEPRQFGVPVQ